MIGDSSPLVTFYNTTIGQTIGSFHGIETEMAAMLEMPDGTANQLTVNFDTISQGMDALGNIDSLLFLEGSNGTLQNQRLATLQHLDGKTQSNTVLMETVLTQRQADANLVGSQNYNILTTLALEANEKAVNEIYLKTVAKGILHFDIVQLAHLHNIANQCPLESGSAVFKARSLLALVENIAFDDEAICEQLEERQAKDWDDTTDFKASFILFPNPAKKQVTALLSGKLYTEKVIKVFDSFGREVHREMIPAGSNSIILDVSSFEAGLYICRLVQSDRETYSKKLIILD